MNGRGYDYNLGRFLSVDPFIVDPGNSQALNPYTYVLNNPLSGTDPTGYATESLEKTIKVKHKAKTGSRIGKVERVTATVNSSGNGVTLTGGSAGARENVTGAIIGAATSSLGGLQSRGQINNLDGSNNSASLNKPGTTTGTTTTGIDSGSPKAPGSAPDTIDLSALDPQFLALWAKSFSGGKSQEQGGTIVEGKTGSEYLVNEDSGTSGSFAPNLTPPSSNFLLLGIFHNSPL